MSLIGGSWKEEPTDEEKYKEITGRDFFGSEKELSKEIDKLIDDGWTSKIERKNLRNFRMERDNRNI